STLAPGAVVWRARVDGKIDVSVCCQLRAGAESVARVLRAVLRQNVFPLKVVVCSVPQSAPQRSPFLSRSSSFALLGPGIDHHHLSFTHHSIHIGHKIPPVVFQPETTLHSACRLTRRYAHHSASDRV